MADIIEVRVNHTRVINFVIVKFLQNRNIAKDKQKYQLTFLNVFSGSRITKSQVY